MTITIAICGIERFLKDTLKLETGKIHEEAHRLEHAFSDESIEKMKKLSGEKKIMEIPDREVYEMREYVRKLIRDLAKVLKDRGISEEKDE